MKIAENMKYSRWQDRFSGTEKKERLFFLTLLILLTGFYIFFIFRNTMPISEGWYSVFAKSINEEGLHPYKDFEMLFPPVYVYLIAFITKIFGYNIIVLRTIGALLFIGIAVLFYFMLTKLFKPFIAMVGAFCSVMFLQTENTFIGYDYIRWFDFFIYLSMLLLLNYWYKIANGVRTSASTSNRLRFAQWSPPTSNCLQFTEWSPAAAGEKKRAFWEKIRSYLCFVHKRMKENANTVTDLLALFSGLSATLALLIRQNSGLIYICCCYVILIVLSFITFYHQKRKVVIRGIIWYTIGVILPIAILLWILTATNTLSIFLESTVTNAIAAKGGLLVELFSWIPRAMKIMWDSHWVMFAQLLALLVGVLVYRLRGKEKELSAATSLCLGSTFFFLMFLGCLATFTVTRLARLIYAYFFVSMEYVNYGVTVIIFLVCIALLIQKKAKQGEDLVAYIMLLGSVIALGYGSGTSAGLSAGETGFTVALIICPLLMFFGSYQRNSFTIVLLCCLTIFVVSCASVKDIIPYSWWGYTETDQEMQCETADVPYLTGLQLSAEKKEMYEGVYTLMQKYLDDDDSLFVTPHCPIFYLIADKTPFTYSYVQWFDVCSDRAIIDDIEKIKEEKPKMIIVSPLQENVMEAHESMFSGGKVSTQRKLMDSLEEFTEKQDYTAVNTYNIDEDGNTVVVYVQIDKKMRK
ncbi:MAG TPA: hypothetical protein PKD52_05545 [Clostridiales bacterium]|nr:hypothetical protein [Clostridiales bacterium]